MHIAARSQSLILRFAAYAAPVKNDERDEPSERFWGHGDDLNAQKYARSHVNRTLIAISSGAYRLNGIKNTPHRSLTAPENRGDFVQAPPFFPHA